MNETADAYTPDQAGKKILMCGKHLKTLILKRAFKIPPPHFKAPGKKGRWAFPKVPFDKWIIEDFGYQNRESEEQTEEITNNLRKKLRRAA